MENAGAQATIRRVIVVLNGGAGTILKTDDPVAEITAAFRAAGVEADVRTVAGGRLLETLAAAFDAPADAVVVGGGDGTVGAAAHIAVARGRPLGILPLGTLNHFAKDAGLPLDLEGAVAAIARGEIGRAHV